MEMRRMLARRRGSRIVDERIVVTVGDNHSRWFYDTFCASAERAINNGKNNVLKRMIDGKRLHDARAFCACGECEIIDGIPLSYAYCCKEAMDVGSACSVAASNLTNKIGSLSCVTKRSSFYSVCLDTEVLNMLSSHEGVCAQWPGVEESLTSRDYRYIAYRAFSYWTHGDDCRGNTLEPPLCVLHRIVQKFPMEDDSSLEQRGLLNVFGIGFYNEYEDQD